MQQAAPRAGQGGRRGQGRRAAGQGPGTPWTEGCGRILPGTAPHRYITRAICVCWASRSVPAARPWEAGAGLNASPEFEGGQGRGVAGRGVVRWVAGFVYMVPVTCPPGGPRPYQPRAPAPPPATQLAPTLWELLAHILKYRGLSLQLIIDHIEELVFSGVPLPFMV